MVSKKGDEPFGKPQFVDVFGGAVAPDFTGLATEKFVTDAIAASPATDLTAYAKLTDASQVVTAQRFAGRALVLDQFLGGSSKGNVGLADLNNGNGLRLGVSIDGKEPTQLAWLSDAYTKTEVDAKVTDLALDIQAVNNQTAATFQLFSDGLQPTFDAKADKATTYTKAEVDAKIPATGGSVDLSAYAKLNDTAQAITAKSATAETFTGVAFQFIKENAPSTAFALADVDGQERPVYAVGSKKFPLAFTTETTGSGSVDLSAYAKKEDADQALLAKTITAQAIGFGDRLLPAVALGYADTGEGYGPRFVVNVGPTNEYLVYKSDLEPFAALLPRIESLEGKSAAGVPTAQSINDPALADFKASVLDEVKKLMAGGKTVPADVGWAKLLNAGTAVNAPEAKVLNGVVYMRGEAVKQGGAGYTANAYQLPPSIPAPPREMVVPLAMKNTSPSGRYYGYATIQTNRQIGVSSDNAFNTVWFDGISYPAYE
jgi:hypothetical protein